MAVASVLVAETALLSLSVGAPFAADAQTAAVSDTTETATSADSVAAALLMARLQDRKIEVLSERSADSTTWALPSGELQTAAYAGPIRVKQGGAWKDIDTSLSDTGAHLTPAAAAADVTVSDGGDTKLASVASGDDRFGLGWSSTLPTPTVKDDTASYDLGGNQTLTVTALAQGFSQNIVLDEAPNAALSYRIPLNLDGLKLSEADSGHLLLKDSDGKLVAEAPAPMMWDSSKNAASGESDHQAKVTTEVETAADGAQSLVLTPDAEYFDQDLTYPVTVDPTSTLAVTTDTWVQTPDYTDSQVSSTELKSGTYDAGADIARAYLKFDVAAFKGKHITDTNLALYSSYSSTCSTSGAGTQVRRITGAWDSSAITWGAQPATTTTGAVTSTAALGYSTACPPGTVNFDIDAIVQAWADGSANYGLRVAGASETDSSTWRRYRSANYASGDVAGEPHLTVTYNSYAATSESAISPSAVNAYSGKRYITSYTPTLSAKVTDPDGSAVKGQFEISNDPAYTGEATYSYTAVSASVASGGTAKLTVPTASPVAGAHLRFRVRGYDGTDYGSWSGYTTFVPNVAKPAAPTIGCDTYAESGWTAKADEAVTCTLDTASADGAGYYWGLDDASVPKRVLDTTNGNGGDALTVSIAPAEGWHTLYVKTVDSGGNISATATSYSFGVGEDGAAITGPQEGITTARRVTLEARGLKTYAGIQWYYRSDAGDEWTLIPASDVTTASSGASVTWPAPMSDGAAAKLTWDVAATLDVDTDLEIRARLSNSSTSAYTAGRSIGLDRAGGYGPARNIGPGSVNLLTGNYSVVETDTDSFDMKLLRRAVSRTSERDGEDDASLVDAFGPGWAAGSGANVQAAGFSTVTKNSDSAVTLTGFDQETTISFTRTNGTWSSGGENSLTLTGTTDATTFTLADDSGIVSTFRLSGTVGTWKLDTVADTSTSDAVSVSQAVISGTEILARPKYSVTAASGVNPADCITNLTKVGCRALEFVYADSTTATASTFGDYTGRVSQVRLWAANPGAGAATSNAAVSYAYDSSGHLRQVWDPRISPALKTTYTYDSADRIATYTAPGRQPWSFTYGSIGNSAASGPGMLLTAKRAGTTLGEPDAVTTVVYGVPLSGSGAPYQMAVSDVARWGQQTAPTDATAVFTSGSVSSNSGADLSKDAYVTASISYSDAFGHAVNEATPGGHITTQEYNGNGDTTYEVTAANRELALGSAPSADDALARLGLQNESNTALRAQQLSTARTYAADSGLLLTETGPLHLVTVQSDLTASTGEASIAAGDVRAARKRVTYTYDEGRPPGAEAGNLVTTKTEGALIDGYGTLADSKVVASAYDWTTGNLTKETADPSGLALATGYAYASDGQINSVSRPGSGAAGKTVTTTARWTGSGSGACAGHPEWAGLTCTKTTAPSSDSTATTVTSYTYDRWGNRATVTVTSGGKNRATTYAYDGAGRLLQTTVTADTGTALPSRTVTYDTVTGLKRTVASDGKTASYGYDVRGRVTNYTDGSGNTTAISYDGLDRVTRTADSTGATTSYAYGTTSDGDRVVTVTDSIAGKFLLSHGAEDRLEAETLPDGSTLSIEYDQTGAAVERLYSAANGTVEMADIVARTITGAYATDSRTAGTSTSSTYTYDAADRLIKVKSTDGDTLCQTRAYTLDNAGNRTALATSTDCSATTSVAYTINAQNQISSSGYSSDAFGNTTATADGTQHDYYSDGTPLQVTHGTDRETWVLDAEQRPGTAVLATNTSGTWTTTSSRTSHYNGLLDGPSWDTDGTTSNRYVTDPDGNLLARTGSTSTTRLQLSDIQGNIAVELTTDTGEVTTHTYDEFGVTASTGRYGWQGVTQAADRRLAGLALMDGRNYAPSLGRYLSRRSTSVTESPSADSSQDSPFADSSRDSINLPFGTEY
ncbi:DNRLRE domain-containing protein [Streptomyces sp. AM 2-1-1]|uniref:DNRLRE domain-containing protein n=1 Tax=Streptomyces sp. AM 2-1-1 TaxID=3028709 RepID=UPI0023B8E99F|nr:DNRLRE domain-containing protein [Streptomyces sp. AM 2-1-1]WEH40023.1 DNRLRE domain-containing protein [Streptomyces sp. AM 2-1-1]